MNIICGVDEVGRGAIAGPMLAAAAAFYCNNNDACPIPGVRDSKAVKSQKEREDLFRKILDCPTLVNVGIGEASVGEIDRLGIDKANELAFTRAVLDLGVLPNHVIVDGVNGVRNIHPSTTQTVVPKADALHWQVSAASIVAKVTRDNLMAEYHRWYPNFDWVNNVGYGTERHGVGIKTFGLTNLHRARFCRAFASKEYSPGGRELLRSRA